VTLKYSDVCRRSVIAIVIVVGVVLKLMSRQLLDGLLSESITDA